MQENIQSQMFEEFEKFLEDRIKKLKEGEIVEGEVIKVEGDKVYVDIGLKSEGIVALYEFRKPPQKGDKVKVYIDAIDVRGGTTLVSKHKADFILAWDKINTAYQNNETLEVEVVRQVKGGLMVDVFGVEAFLPGSQIDIKKIPPKQISSYVGKKIEVKIIKVNKARKNIIVSRREVLLERLEQKRKKFLEIKVGDVVKGKVKAIKDFGVFVSIDEDIDGFVPLIELSWEKLTHPEDVVKLGDELELKVIKVDPEEFKLTLSRKVLLPHPWEKIKEKYKPGSRVKGVVKSITDFGVFVEVEPGVEGLIHLNELSWKTNTPDPNEIVKVGDEVEVVVLSVDPERRRMALSLKRTQPDPWATIEERYPIGAVVKGVVKKIDNNEMGAIIDLEEDVIGYLHISNVSWTKRIDKISDVIKPGRKLKFKVLGVDKRRRKVELGIKQLYQNPWPQIEEKLPRGKDIKAEVKDITKTGIIVEIDQGLMGYIPVRELWRRGDPQENYLKGEELNVKVLRVEPARRRVLLSEKEYYKEKEKLALEKYTKAEPVKINLGEILKKEVERLEEILKGEEE